MGFHYLGLTDEIGDPVTVGPREPRDCARALELLAPIAKVGEWGGFRQDFEWSIVDKLQVPADIAPGRYALSWRWDCEQTSQVWAHCSAIDIKLPSSESHGPQIRMPTDRDAAVSST